MRNWMQLVQNILLRVVIVRKEGSQRMVKIWIFLSLTRIVFDVIYQYLLSNKRIGNKF